MDEILIEWQHQAGVFAQDITLAEANARGYASAVSSLLDALCADALRQRIELRPAILAVTTKLESPMDRLESPMHVRPIIVSVSSDVYCSAAFFLTCLPRIVGRLQGSTVFSRANTAPIYILTSHVCSTHQYAAFQSKFVPFPLHTTERKIQIVVIRN